MLWYIYHQKDNISTLFYKKDIWKPFQVSFFHNDFFDSVIDSYDYLKKFMNLGNVKSNFRFLLILFSL